MTIEFEKIFLLSKTKAKENKPLTMLSNKRPKIKEKKENKT